jgi:predicted acylesterase/phospholipase RssA
VAIIIEIQPETSLIFQAAKLGDIECLLSEIDQLPNPEEIAPSVSRVYGLSGGALGAVGFALALSAIQEPAQFQACEEALSTLRQFLISARSRDIRRLNLNPWYGFNNLEPLRDWLVSWLRSMGMNDAIMLGALPVSLYLCVGDRDGTFTIFGPPDEELTFQYGFVQVGPPEDARLLDALIAAVSTSISIVPAQVDGDWYRDARPAVPDGRAVIADLEASDPRPIIGIGPFTPLPNWRLNWITSSFIMHRHHERNQSLLVRYYLDLLERHRSLKMRIPELDDAIQHHDAPVAHHIDLPYVGSTEAFTNLKQSVARKESLMVRFENLLEGQFDGFDFGQSANVIYGAGGFSGILAGLVTTRSVEAGFVQGGGSIQQIYGVSAGVLNGFFHAVQLVAASHPDLYRPEAHRALADLEDFMAEVRVNKIARLNLNPRRFCSGWANLEPLREFLLERLSAYTGRKQVEELTFDDVNLPLTIAAAREDGLTDFLGKTEPKRVMHFGGELIEVKSAPIVDAILAGWSMNTYLEPTRLGDQRYRDGGGSFYDIGLFVACLDESLINLLNIHLDEPEGHSYGLPPRPSLVRLVFDTHNYNFPEERRRMRALTDLLYRHYRFRSHAKESGIDVESDFRRDWQLGRRASFHRWG